MKKVTLLVVILFVCMAMTVVSVSAAETSKKLTFQWDQLDLANVHHWNVYWSDVSGQYLGDPVVVVNYDPATGDTTAFSHTEQLTVVGGEQGSTITKYFVMTAATENDAVESTYSNEVPVVFEVPMGGPFNFTITVVVE